MSSSMLQSLLVAQQRNSTKSRSSSSGALPQSGSFCNTNYTTLAADPTEQDADFSFDLINRIACIEAFLQQVKPNNQHDFSPDLEKSKQNFEQALEKLANRNGFAVLPIAELEKSKELVFDDASDNYLAVKNAHERDKLLNFDEKEHKYSLANGGNAALTGKAGGGFRSVTACCDSGPGFNGNMIASKIIKSDRWANDPSYEYYQKTKEEILKTWDFARDLGTELHRDIELFLNRKGYLEDSFLQRQLSTSIQLEGGQRQLSTSIQLEGGSSSCAKKKEQQAEQVSASCSPAAVANTGAPAGGAPSPVPVKPLAPASTSQFISTPFSVTTSIASASSRPSSFGTQAFGTFAAVPPFGSSSGSSSAYPMGFEAPPEPASTSTNGSFGFQPPPTSAQPRFDTSVAGFEPKERGGQASELQGAKEMNTMTAAVKPASSSSSSTQQPQHLSKMPEEFIERTYFLAFLKDVMETRKWKPYRTEWRIFDADLGIAGTIDFVVIADRFVGQASQPVVPAVTKKMNSSAVTTASKTSRATSKAKAGSGAATTSRRKGSTASASETEDPSEQQQVLDAAGKNKTTPTAKGEATPRPEDFFDTTEEEQQDQEPSSTKRPSVAAQNGNATDTVSPPAADEEPSTTSSEKEPRDSVATTSDSVGSITTANKKQEVILIDWKRTKQVKKQIYRNQLNIYRYILEKNYDNVKVTEMYVVRLHPQSPSYDLCNIDLMEDTEVQALLA
ncbi:unnamed protein product [Amoebophrya sp. A120]|nr:unnamed protein product [Amoebophrya sp. A120]|eukprot:GSA120T00019818001.1